MRYILGIDQGGSKTAAAVMNENGILSGAGYAGGAYFPRQGVEAAASEMEDAVGQALKQAGIGTDDIAETVAGITGVDFPGDDISIRNVLEKKIGKKVQIYNDCVIALYGGTLKGTGVIICAGTGLNAAICGRDGENFVFGDYLGRELQGGCAIANRGIRAVFDAALGIGSAEKLTKLFLEFSGADSVDRLLRMYMQDRDFQERLRFIVPDLIGLAISGDEATDRLVQKFAEELSVYMIAGLRRVGLLDVPVDIVLAGNVLKGKENPLSGYLMQYINAAAPLSKMIYAKYEPVVGACIMGALRLKCFSAEMEKGLAESAERLSLLRD